MVMCEKKGNASKLRKKGERNMKESSTAEAIRKETESLLIKKET